MKKNIPIYLYGSIIILLGVYLLFTKNIAFNTIKFTLGIASIFGALFAIISAYFRYRKQVQFTYHKMHALAMLFYGISVICFCNSPEKLLWVTSFLLFFYAFSEIIFCNWLFNLAQKGVFKIVVIRLLLGLIVGVGTVVAIHYTTFSLQLFGVLFIIIGINVLFYVPVMKAKRKKIINFKR